MGDGDREMVDGKMGRWEDGKWGVEAKYSCTGGAIGKRSVDLRSCNDGTSLGQYFSIENKFTFDVLKWERSPPISFLYLFLSSLMKFEHLS